MRFLHGWPQYLYGYGSGVSAEMPKDAKRYSYFVGICLWRLLILRKLGESWKKNSKENLVQEVLSD
jgi:hypothetical protein